MTQAADPTVPDGPVELELLELVCRICDVGYFCPGGDVVGIGSAAAAGLIYQCPFGEPLQPTLF